MTPYTETLVSAEFFTYRQYSKELRAVSSFKVEELLDVCGRPQRFT